MVANFGHVVFAQVRQLLSNLNKKNFKATSCELNQVHGVQRDSLPRAAALKNVAGVVPGCCNGLATSLCHCALGHV